jgi:hypothetical protein
MSEEAISLLDVLQDCQAMIALPEQLTQQAYISPHCGQAFYVHADRTRQNG